MLILGLIIAFIVFVYLAFKWNNDPVDPCTKDPSNSDCNTDMYCASNINNDVQCQNLCIQMPHEQSKTYCKEWLCRHHNYPETIPYCIDRYCTMSQKNSRKPKCDEWACLYNDEPGRCKYDLPSCTNHCDVSGFVQYDNLTIKSVFSDTYVFIDQSTIPVRPNVTSRYTHAADLLLSVNKSHFILRKSPTDEGKYIISSSIDYLWTHALMSPNDGGSSEAVLYKDAYLSAENAGTVNQFVITNVSNDMFTISNGSKYLTSRDGKLMWEPKNSTNERQLFKVELDDSVEYKKHNWSFPINPSNVMRSVQWSYNIDECNAGFFVSPNSTDTKFEIKGTGTGFWFVIFEDLSENGWVTTHAIPQYWTDNKKLIFNKATNGGNATAVEAKGSVANQQRIYVEFSLQKPVLRFVVSEGSAPLYLNYISVSDSCMPTYQLKWQTTTGRASWMGYQSAVREQ